VINVIYLFSFINEVGMTAGFIIFVTVCGVFEWKRICAGFQLFDYIYIVIGDHINVLPRHMLCLSQTRNSNAIYREHFVFNGLT
jgi:hypothetical protein